MCAIDDAEPSDVWHETYPTARKPWKCVECGRVIAAGERYRRIKSLYEGRWDIMQICRHCAAASQWLSTVCGGYLVHGLAEELREHWDEGYRSILMGRLILGIRDRWHNGSDPVPDVKRVRSVARWSMEQQVMAS